LAYPLLKSRLGLLAAVALASGCFTSPVNMRPQLTIEGPPAGVFRGVPALFKATPSDPDGETPSVDWEVASKCPDDATDPSTWLGVSSTGDSYEVLARDTVHEFCIRARARDSHGATVIVAKTITPADRAPTAGIKLTTPPPSLTQAHPGSFPVHTQLVFEENAEDADPLDGADLMFAWSLEIDSVPSVVPLACDGDLSHKKACVNAAVPGSYDLKLVVSDGVEMTVGRFPFLVLPGTPPNAHLDVVTPAPHELGTTIELSAIRSTPETGLTAKFMITPPGGSPRDADPCPDATSNLKACFTPTIPGSYTATLDVLSDGGGSKDSQRIDVGADRLPCMRVTDPARAGTAPNPILRIPPPNPLEDYSFSIKTVDDDLDGGDDLKVLNASYFEWLVSVGGNPFTLLATGPVLSIPQHEYPSGTAVGLRLQLRDRNRMGGDAKFASCGSAPECHTTDTCFQRWTWTVTFQ
jgi:hypothetical protein